MLIREKTELDRSYEMVKVAVDIKRSIVAAYCELHTDCAEELVADGSLWENVWGANVYPKDMGIAFHSMINLRPNKGNRSMEIQSSEIRKEVESVIRGLLS